jgi:hypothetical protein
MNINEQELKNLNSTSLVGLIIGIIFIIPGVLLMVNDWIIIGLILLAVGIITVIPSIRALSGGNLNTLTKKAEKKENAALRAFERKRVFEDMVNAKISEFGELTKIISWWEYNPMVEKSLLVFEASKTIIIANDTFKFDDIVSFEVFDNSKTIYSGSVSTTKTKTGSMVGRAVVGGVLFGGVGAVVGGATAGKKAITEGQTARISHYYTVVITINSLSNPIVKINLWQNQNAMQEITSILTIITSR